MRVGLRAGLRAPVGREAERTGLAVGIGRGLGPRGGPSPRTVRLQGWAAGLPAVTARLPRRRSCSALLRSSPRACHDGITVQGELLGKSAGRAADLRAPDPPGQAVSAGPRHGQADGRPRSAPLRGPARGPGWRWRSRSRCSGSEPARTPGHGSLSAAAPSRPRVCKSSGLVPGSSSAARAPSSSYSRGRE